jgi:hypothetical protein
LPTVFSKRAQHNASNLALAGGLAWRNRLRLDLRQLDIVNAEVILTHLER